MIVGGQFDVKDNVKHKEPEHDDDETDIIEHSDLKADGDPDTSRKSNAKEDGKPEKDEKSDAKDNGEVVEQNYTEIETPEETTKTEDGQKESETEPIKENIEHTETEKVDVESTENDKIVCDDQVTDEKQDDAVQIKGKTL